MDWQIYSISEFEQHRQTWDHLNSQNGSTPLLDSRFVVPLLHHFGSKKEKLAVCAANGAVCAMGIFVKNRFGAWQTFQPAQAPIGCWLQGTAISTSQLAITLQKSLPGICLILGISQQDPDLLPRPEHSSHTGTLDYISTASIKVEGSFDDYWSKRGKNLRQNLRRQRNRLARENIETRLSMVRDPALIQNAVEAYGILESAGWKSDSNTAVSINNAQGRFYEEMLKNFAESSQAIVFQYHYNDQLVATDLCIIGDCSLIILKTTYDESITTSSPAMLMREDAFNYIFSEELASRIEFYGKVMDWHTRWAEDIRTMYHINLYSRLGAMLKSRDTD